LKLAAETSPKRGQRTLSSQTPQRSHDHMKSVDHIEQLLDHALEATFPASDPVAVSPTAALAAPPPACPPEPGGIE
jgi:hypothetical protein